ncbi:Ig-like domain-containing protein [Vibrio cholerae]|uniref:Ig-like domain-containing protein n=2 Tax=Vibrio cholerae TaxID=666 RepID=UPI002FDC4671
MNQYNLTKQHSIKFLYNIYIFSSLMLLIGLTGCKSDRVFDKDEIAIVNLERIIVKAVNTNGQIASQLTLAAGLELSFHVIGYYSDGSFDELTSLKASNWHTSDHNIAFFERPGILKAGMNQGAVMVYVTMGDLVSNKLSVRVAKGTITKIDIRPLKLGVVKGQTQPLTATATYSDNRTEDITSSVLWTINDISKISIDDEGGVTGQEVGDTSITATKDKVKSSIAIVDVCQDLAGPCIDIFDVGDGRFFTNSPSVPYLDNFMYVKTDSMLAEDNITGPKGNFYRFTWANAKELCNSYNIQMLGRRNNWRLPTLDELKAHVYDSYNPIFATRGWPSGSSYWTSTSNGDRYYFLSLNNGTVISHPKEYTHYSSCFSSPENAEIVEIVVSPTSVGMLKGATQKLTVIARYGDNSTEDITAKVQWSISDLTKATITSDGLITGSMLGTTTIRATKDGVLSNSVNVNICENLAGPCIDIFDVGGGILFTNSPSVSYLDSIGSIMANGIIHEYGVWGPTGYFYKFNWINAYSLCNSYNKSIVGGRANWVLATRDDLRISLFDILGPMFSARGWPAGTYWTSTSDGSNYNKVDLFNGSEASTNPNATLYASCVSNP